MTKSDLKTGMIVTLRNRNEYVFLKDFVVDDDYTMGTCNDGVLVNGQRQSWMRMLSYDDNLKMKNTLDKEFDIMKVEIPDHVYAFTDILYNKKRRKLVWERKEIKKMTVAEIEAIFGYKIEIVSEAK